MGCLIGLIGVFAPRVALVLLWFFSDYLGEAYETRGWPLLGFLFMPFTTLAYAFAWHLGGGDIQGIGLFLIILAVLMDFGIIGGGANEATRRRGRAD